MTAARRGGFTLLEAIVALAVISVVCVGILAAQGAALRAEASVNTRLPLAALAEERISAIDLYPGALESLPDSLTRGVFPAPFENVRWSIRTHAVIDAHNLWDVQVTASSATDSITLVTRRFRASEHSP